MTFSPEQNAIFNWFRSGKGNLVVEANAGCAKTTTIVHGFPHAPERRILYGVFNKKNQKEAETKIKDGRVQVRTWHSIGFTFIKKIWPQAKPDPNLETERVESILTPHGFGNDKILIGMVARLVGFVKNTFIEPTQDDIYETAQEREIIDGNTPSRTAEMIVTACARVLELSKKQDAENRISFDDMVWLPCAMKIVAPMFDLVVGDEAQDLNMPQLEMMKRCCKPTGRICVVGDSRQAIYTFRGAVHEAMQKMRNELSAAVLTLSVTYRCPQKIVELAKEIVPNYVAASEAPIGEIYHAQAAEPIAQIGDAILSRLNAPLMPLALSFLRRNVPARIEGRDIGKQLLNRVRSFKATSVPNFLERVQAWETKEIARLEKTKNPEKKMEQTRDIGETLRALAMDAKSVSDIDNRINNLFQDTNEQSKPCVLLSSVHKAKGLEWNRVILLTGTFRNGKGIQEEDNIWYVAITRVKKTLIWISDYAPGNYQAPPTKPMKTKCPPRKISTPAPDNTLIGQKELDRIEREADAALKRAERIARDNEVYLSRGVRPSEQISLAREDARRAEEQTVTGETLEEQIKNSMCKKTNKGKNKKAAAPAERKNGIFGYSVAAVCRAMGKMGATKKQTLAVMKKLAKDTSEITVSVQWDSGNGGFNRGEPAPITKDQFAELMKDAPKAEEKAAKKPTAKKASKVPVRKPAKKSGPPARKPAAVETPNAPEAATA